MFRRPSLLSDISSLRSAGEDPSLSSHASLTGPSPLDEITAPHRELTADEIAELSSVVRSCLKLNNCACVLQAEEDANDFVNYAVDLVTDGLCVIGVLEELDFMEMTDICPPASLDEMRSALPAFLGALHEKDGAENPCKRLQASADEKDSYAARRRLSQELREGDNYLAGVDLSAKTAANKKRQELAMLQKRGTSIKDRMGMFSNDGTLRSSFRNPNGGVDVTDVDDLDPETMDQASLDARREAELSAIMSDVSLTEKEQTDKMKEVRGKYGVIEMKIRIARASQNAKRNDVSKAEGKDSIPRAERELRKGRRSSIDLSANSAVANKAKELALVQKQGRALRDRMSMYTDDGSLRSSFKNPHQIDLADLEADEDVKEKTIDDLRREELMAVMKDKTLSREERTQKMDEVRARYEEAAATAAEEALDEAIDEAKLRAVQGCGDTYTTASSLTDHDGMGPPGHGTGSAFSSSPIDEIAAPQRDLAEDEVAELRALIKGTLKLNNVSCALDAEEDAIDLVNYAIDLITDCMCVGVILEELDFMELEICPASSLAEMRGLLANYFGKLHKKDTGKNPLDQQCQTEVVVQAPNREAAHRRGRRTSIDRQAGAGVPRRRLSQEMREGANYLAGVDLSAKTAVNKKRQELAMLQKRGTSIKDRMDMYSGDGTLAGSFESNASGESRGHENMDQATVDARRRDELEAIAFDMTLTEEEQAERMEEVRAKYGVLETKVKTANASAASNSKEKDGQGKRVPRSTAAGKDSVPRAERERRPGKGRRSSIDLSAKSTVVNKAKELARIKKQGSSIKDRMAMYSNDGTLRGSFRNPHKLDVEELQKEKVKEKSVDDLRREELMAVMRDRSLSREEKTRKMDAIREKYAPPEAIIRESQEQASDEENKGVSMEARRRQELKDIMRDKTLSKIERKQKIDAVNMKYSPKQTHKGLSPSSSSDETMETAASTTAGLDLSSKCSAGRRRASLESLQNSIASDGVMSLQERREMYANNEFVVKA